MSSMASQSKRGPLIVEPGSHVRFPGPPMRPARATLKLINNTTNRIAFKIKTTAPSFYGVRPNTGIVMPRTTSEVDIARQPFTQEQLLKINHKFMVQSFEVPDDVEDVSKLWNTIDPSKLGIVKLRCVFEGIPTSREQMVKPQESVEAAKEPKEALSKEPTKEPLINPKPMPAFQTVETQVSRPFRTAQMTQTSMEPLPLKESAEKKPQDVIKKRPLADSFAQRSASMESIRRMLNAKNGNNGRNGKENKPKYVDNTQQVSQALLVTDYSTMSQVPVDKNTQYSYHSQDSTSVASKTPISPKLSPVRLPSPPTYHKTSLPLTKEATTKPPPAKPREMREIRKLQNQKNDDIFTALQLATMNTEIHHLRTENKHLRNENYCLKKEAQSQNKIHKPEHHSPVRREYTIPHAQLPQQETMVPICYIVASMTFALLCLIIGKFIL